MWDADLSFLTKSIKKLDKKYTDIFVEDLDVQLLDFESCCVQLLLVTRLNLLKVAHLVTRYLVTN